ncbi:hypothetical protein BG000_008062 [Podila horticola]|nr:hypothetical protein BG000_008062 [Podila horticola]
MKVLILGGTGNVGKLVIQQLLERDIEVKAVVRSSSRLPSDSISNPNLTAIQANLLDLSVSDLASHLKGCDAVVCTLGHNMSYGRVPGVGIWLNTRDLVTRATKMVCDAVRELQPETPIRFVLLNTIGVKNSDGSDTWVRTRLERGLVSFMTGVLPPYTDSVRSAQHISQEVGKKDSKYLEWVTVRPDGFIDGPVSEYKTMESIQHSFYAPDYITKANIAHFMCELLVGQQLWEQWKFKMPLIIDAKQPEKK